MNNTQLFTVITIDDLSRIIKESVKCEVLQIINSIPQKSADELIDIGEASKFLHVSKVTIHKWKKKKLIGSYRIGRRIYFKKYELIESMNKFSSRR